MPECRRVIPTVCRKKRNMSIVLDEKKASKGCCVRQRRAFEYERGVLRCDDLCIGPDGGGTHPSLRSELVLLDELGRGSGGSVARAVHGPSGVVVAVKRMAIADESKRHQMLDEVRALHGLKKGSQMAARIHHGIVATEEEGDDVKKFFPRSEGDDVNPPSHVVDFLDAFVDPTTHELHLVLEFMNLGPLKKTADEGLLSRVAYCVLSALRDIHGRRELHRDVKPSNILLNSAGDVKVSDYGCYRAFDEKDASLATTFTGTVAFMSPERIKGDEYSYAADVWSLGISLVATATGANPYAEVSKVYWDVADAIQKNPAPSLPAATFSSDFRHFVDLCLEKDPAKRPSAASLLATHPFVRAGAHRQKGSRLFYPTFSTRRLADILLALAAAETIDEPNLPSLAAQLGVPAARLRALWPKAKLAAHLQRRNQKEEEKPPLLRTFSKRDTLNATLSSLGPQQQRSFRDALRRRAAAAAVNVATQQPAAREKKPLNNNNDDDDDDDAPAAAPPQGPFFLDHRNSNADDDDDGDDDSTLLSTLGCSSP